MRRRERPTGAAPLFVAAATAYGANCALGLAVATRVIDTRDFRWVHHALYIATCVTTSVAVVGALHTRSTRAALALAPAAVPLAAIPHLGTHTRRHPLIALTAAPFIVAGLLAARHPDRK